MTQSFDQWLDEVEGFSTRRERAEEALGPAYEVWLRAAWDGGKVNDMSSAPTDRPVMLHMPDGKSFRGELRLFYDCDGAGWVCLEEGEEPADWSDGVCWAVNGGGQPSTKPVGWTEVDEEAKA